LTVNIYAIILFRAAGDGSRPGTADALPVLVQSRLFVGRRGKLRRKQLFAAAPWLTASTVKTRSRFHRRRPDRSSQCRRWIMVDGPVEARQAHGRAVPIQLCRTPQQRLPAMEPQRQWRQHGIEAGQRAGTGEASTAKDQEHVQEAIHSLCSCRRPKSCCSGARKIEGGRRRIAQWQSEDENTSTLLVDEEVVDGEP
jgi:hypothetical protein